MPNFNELNEMDREEYLKQLEQQQFDKQIDEKARLASLQKLRDQGLGQQFKGGYENAPSLNTRRYGPYELDTILDQSHTIDKNNEHKSGELINVVKFLGGQHSPEDAKKIADELKMPGKKADYENISKSLFKLKDDDDSFVGVQGKIMEASNRPELGPLWYEESPEEKQKRLDKFNKLKTTLQK
jgi:hypothetical protein